MKKILLLVLLSINSVSMYASAIAELRSPDGKYLFTIYQNSTSDSTSQLSYKITYDGRSVVEQSDLGVMIENRLFESALGISNDNCKLWSENLYVTNKKFSTEDNTWAPLYGERATVRDNYNQLVVSLRKGSQQQGKLDAGYDKQKYYFMDIIVRAYDQGVAFRYNFPESQNGLFLHITGEQTAFTMPEGTQAYYARWAQGPYSLRELKNWDHECERPLTMKLTNGLTVSIAEAEMVDYARMKLRLSSEKPNTLCASLYSSVDVITPYSTPWRVVMAAEKPSQIVQNNDIILNLNPANQIPNTEWIVPGKVIRVASVTQKGAKECIDFAAAHSLQYVHIDAGWYGPEMKMSSDATTVSPDKDINIEELTAYGASKGIGLLVYVNQRALIQQLDQILPLYKKWGIKGIKFGFVQVGNQYWTKWMHDAVKKCAEHQMMVDIHDEYRPTGFSRTYPNLMTQEGIHGNEEMPDATSNTILPFTRFVAGAGDYTICYYNTRIKTTHAHQLALSVIYYSPLQFMYWYDNPSAYRGEPEIEFFDNVKTVWDDTKVVDGQIGEYVVTARRSGTEWFVGAITNNDARSITIPTDFLDTGKRYTVKIYEDDPKTKTRTQVKISNRKIVAGNVLKFDLRPSAGVALHFVPQN